MLGKRITELREAQGLSSAALARMAKIAAPSLWEIEQGETKSLRADTLMRLAEALKINPVYLWSGKGNPAATIDPNDEEAEAVELLRRLKPQSRLAWIAGLRAFVVTAPPDVANPYPQAAMPLAPKRKASKRSAEEKLGKK